MNKNAKNKIITISVVFLALVFSVGGYFINKYWHKYVKSHPKMYIYEYIRNDSKPVSVLLINDLDLKEPYLKYYFELESGIEPILSNEIILKGLPTNYPVYVIDYTKDSLLAQVVSYFDRGIYGGSYTKGWVYSKTLNINPPDNTN